MDWDKKRTQALTSGKLDTYFSIKSSFEMENYLQVSLSKFSLHKSLCKLRVSGHSLMIESGRYNKNHLQREERICKNSESGK